MINFELPRRSPGRWPGNHSCILAWKIPCMEKPGRSIGLQRVRHDWSNLASRPTWKWLSGKESAHQYRGCKTYRFDPWVGKILWRRKWQCTPVLLIWKISRTEKPGGPQSMGLQRVRHDWETEWARSALSKHLNKNNTMTKTLQNVITFQTNIPKSYIMFI